MLAHLLVVLGVVAMGVIFHRAKPKSTYRDFAAEDGTAQDDNALGA